MGLLTMSPPRTLVSSSFVSGILGGELTGTDGTLDVGSSAERDRPGSPEVLRSVMGVKTLLSGTDGGSSSCPKSSGGNCILNSPCGGFDSPGESSALFALALARKSSELTSGKGGKTGGLSSTGLCSRVPRILSASMPCSWVRMVAVRPSRTSSDSASSRSKNSIWQLK